MVKTALHRCSAVKVGNGFHVQMEKDGDSNTMTELDGDKSGLCCLCGLYVFLNELYLLPTSLDLVNNDVQRC